MTQTQNSVPLKRYYNSSETKIFLNLKNVLTTKGVEALIGYLEGDSKKSCCCVGCMREVKRNGLCLKLGPKQLADENKSKSCKEVMRTITPQVCC
jgi:hypothetical protein